MCIVECVEKCSKKYDFWENKLIYILVIGMV